MHRLFIIATLCLAGCAPFYRHQVYNEDYTLYTDLTLTKTTTTREHIRQVMRAYRELFPERGASVSAPIVVCSEDPLAAQEVYTSELKQEGYYLPLFGLVNLTRQFPKDEGGEERTIILHELTHHFLISAFPDSRSLYWLNEGLACCLEVSFFDADEKLQLPLFHPWLYGQARFALLELGEDGFNKTLASLLDCSWFQFHQGEQKSRNYALSWAFTYLLIQAGEGTLENRVERIMALDEHELRAEVANVTKWVSGDAQDHLERFARNPTFTAWAVARWLELDQVDARRVLPYFSSDLAASGTVRASGFRALLKLLSRRPGNLTDRARDELNARVVEELKSGPRATVLEICGSLQPEARDPSFLLPLAELLARDDADVRVAAAGALSRISRKPTIVRPGFWRSGSLEARNAEITEWKNYISALAYPTAEQARAGASR